MCTAATYRTDQFYFGRTLDNGCSYGEEVVVTPRRYPFPFRHGGRLDRHYAIIGMAHVAEGCPLYYDAANEAGLAMAGLNFPESAVYAQPAAGQDNICQFELIPWLLGTCATVEEVRGKLRTLRLVDTPFAPELPAARLHWLVADRRECIVVEAVAEGLKVYDDPAGVLTNEPPFPQQWSNLRSYLSLSPREPENRFAPGLDLTPYGLGLGGVGLPGDLSSMSRFVRAAFTRCNAVSGPSEEESVNQFFHILGTVSQTRGCCVLKDGGYEMTLYTSCCNVSAGTYYYTTYENHQLSAVDMRKENLEGETLSRFPLLRGEQVEYQN